MLARVVTVLIASQSANLTRFEIALLIGLFIAIFGHIIKSRPVIIAGLLVLGGGSAYFSFVLQPTAH